VGQVLRTLMHSIRFRLTVWFVAVLALVLVGFSTFIYTRQTREYALETSTRVVGKARQLETYYRYLIRQANEREHGDTLPPNAVQGQMPLLQDDDVLLLLDAKGQAIQALGPITTTDVSTLLQNAPKTVSAVSPNGSPRGGGGPPEAQASATSGVLNGAPYQFVTLLLPMGNGGVTLILGSPIDSGNQSGRLLLTLVLGSLGILFIALAGGYWLAGRVMHPVQIITRTARSISETDLSRRLKMGGHDELSELADTFDAMLDRLQAGFERQRQFTADASHELRTPLTIIELEASRTLLHPRQVHDYERALRTIQSENELMSHIVNDLLMLARMDAGQTTLKSERLDLSDVALDVVERLSPLAKQKHVELIAGELPEVLICGDRQFLIQMVSNLVENGIKYSSPQNEATGKHAHVRVETGCAPMDSRTAGTQTPATHAWVRVEDNGPGIPADYIPKLFDRFYRVDAARTRPRAPDNTDEIDSAEPGGSGLGLSIVQWIAASHHGRIEVSSQEGHGATFTVWLPLA
jgi:signal transduction histidine kinase